MAAVIGKIWILGGWFYLSLVGAIFVYFAITKALKNYLSIGVVTCGAILALILSFGEIVKTSQIQLFFRPIDEKIEVTTFGQASFAKHLGEILPLEARGCIYWSWDLPTLYLQKELYPRVFGVIADDAHIEKCNWVISQFTPRDDSRLQLVDAYNGNYLYKVKR